MVVSLLGVTQRYGATPSLHDVDLDVRPGEFLALVGPSGAGKTTMLRLIAGLETRFTGTLRIAGKDMAGVPARRRNIGFVFQNYALFRHMTVAENVAFGLRVQGRMARADIRKRVAELLTLVQIPHLAERRPGQLSGGQQQRVALARALATEPSLMLLDEPFGALDPLVRKDIRNWLRGLHAQLGLTSIFITHDQGEAIELADRVAVMRGGRIVQIGTPAELEANPADPFVFTFLGPSIRLDGHVRAGLFHADYLPVQPYRVTAENGAAIALLRQHQLALLPNAGDSTILAARQAGPLVHYTVQAGARQLDIVGTTAALPVGTKCGLAITEAAIFPNGAALPPAPDGTALAREAVGV
jgi:sulfate transport system ATP-binding protein